jgi:cytochrome d ubiquinol oxidase subunit I
VPAGGWLEIIFNPSFPYRLVHTVIAAYLTTALVVGGVGAWHLLKGRDMPGVRKMFSMAMWMAALVAPVQIFVGDLHGLNTMEHQPAKVMAMEGHFESYPNGAPLILIGMPDSEAEKTRVLLEIPKLSSLILKHDRNAPLKGLKTIPKENRPPAEIVFWSFRIMVGLGFLMLVLGLFSLLARAMKRLYDWRLLHRFALLMGPAGFVAVIAGWVTTEVGRQPWVIYNLMRTAEARSPIAAPAVATSLLAFVVVYFIVFGIGTWYILKLMARPPYMGEPEPAEAPIRTAGLTAAPSIHGRGADPKADRSEGAD